MNMNLNMNELFSQVQSSVALYAEVLICIVAAGILGCVVGLMMQRSKHKKKLIENTNIWQRRCDTLEQTAVTEASNLEEQLQSLAKQTKTLQATNAVLTDTIKTNDTNTQKARAESIELNRHHSETHERLLRIIQQKDREIAKLDHLVSRENNTKRSMKKAEATITKLRDSNKEPNPLNTGLDGADTVAIAPSKFSTDALEATVQMEMEAASVPQTSKKLKIPIAAVQEPDLEDTADLRDFALEESTVAMDEDALSLARLSRRHGQND